MKNKFDNMPVGISAEKAQTYADCILCLALDVGEGMLKNGDSVHHVEDTVKRICMAYGGVHIETFVISSLILASVRLTDGSYSSQIRRVYFSENNMSVLENYNSLSRSICAQTPDFETAQQMLRDVKNKKAYPRWLLCCGGALAAASFAVFFGGSVRDGVAGGLIGLLTAFLSSIRYTNLNALAKTAVLSFFAGLMSYFTVLVGVGQNVDMVMIGSIMLLIPGLAFGNALRDLLCGDILTGVLKTVQSCLTAVLIACGFSGAILLTSKITVLPEVSAIQHGFVIQFVTAMLGTLAFSGVFCVRPKYFLMTVVGGGAVYSTYYLALKLGMSVFAAAFCCAVFGAIYSEVCARRFRVPAIVFLTTAIISIVPGGGLYYTMKALLSADNATLYAKASQTLYVSAGLAVGTIAVTLITAILFNRSNNKKRGLK